MTIAAGRRRHLITIEHDTGTAANSFGEHTALWTSYSRQYAAVEPLSVKEQMNGAQPVGTVSHRITIPYIAGVTGDMRIRFGTRYLYPVGPPIDADERHRELVLMCAEREA